MIVTNPNELRKECKEVSLFEAQSIIIQLEEELNKSSNGIGLAANQIGIDAKVCFIKVDKPFALVNPIIIELENLMEFHNEGCLSFPEEFVKTKRYNEVVVKDTIHPNGIVCVGLEAVVVQHEVGHLYGEIMYDYEIQTPGPNLKCWCGSDKKYKKCHMNKVIKCRK